MAPVAAPQSLCGTMHLCALYTSSDSQSSYQDPLSPTAVIPPLFSELTWICSWPRASQPANQSWATGGGQSRVAVIKGTNHSSPLRTTFLLFQACVLHTSAGLQRGFSRNVSNIGSISLLFKEVCEDMTADQRTELGQHFHFWWDKTERVDPSVVWTTDWKARVQPH